MDPNCILEYCFVLKNRNPFYNFDNNEVLAVVVELNDIEVVAVVVVGFADSVIVFELEFAAVLVGIVMDYLVELGVANYY